MILTFFNCHVQLRHNLQLTESGQYLVEVEYTINSLELHNNE